MLFLSVFVTPPIEAIKDLGLISSDAVIGALRKLSFEILKLYLNLLQVLQGFLQIYIFLDLYLGRQFSGQVKTAFELAACIITVRAVSKIVTVE